MSFIWKMKQKEINKCGRSTLIKINKLTIQYSGWVDDLNICYYLKLPSRITPFKILFYKNIATNEDFMNNCCSPNQTKFSDKWIFCGIFIIKQKMKENIENSFLNVSELFE